MRADSPERNIYEPRFVAALFDEMSATYGVTNYVCSFGFCERWRRRAVDGLALAPGAHVIEMMCGAGECWPFLQRRLGRKGRVVALDLSSEMCRRARDNVRRFSELEVDVVQCDALACGLPDGQADHVLASFGLKTFSPEQLDALAGEVWRLLKPGGTFSFVEIAVPRAAWLRIPYVFYLRSIIPLVGRCFLGNPDNYRMLAMYTERFAAGELVRELFEARGFRVRVEDLFFGCARRIVGVRGNVDVPLAQTAGFTRLAVVIGAFSLGALAAPSIALLPDAITFARAYFDGSYAVVVWRSSPWSALLRLSALGGLACALVAFFGVLFWQRNDDER